MEKKKGLLLLFAFLIVLTSIMFLPAVHGQSWNSYQHDIQNTGQNTQEASDFSTNGTVSNIFNVDADSQALIVDLNQDGTKDVIVYDDDTIYLLDSNMLITQQVTLPSSITSSLSIYEESGVRYVSVITQNSAFLLTPTLSNQINYTLSSINSTVSCVTDVGCYALYDSNTINSRIIQFNTTVSENATLGINLTQQPSLEMSIETTNNAKAYVSCDPDKNGRYGICAINLAGLNMDNTFSGDGIIDNLNDNAANAGQISAPLTYAFDGGLQEIAISYITCTAGLDTNYNLVAYRADGTLYGSRTIVLLDDRGSCNAVSQFSSPVIANIANRDHLCGIAEGQPASYGGEERGLFCFDVQDLSSFTSLFNPAGDQIFYNLVAADFNGDTVASTDYDDFLYYAQIYDETGTSIDNLNNQFLGGSRMSFSDVNNDDVGDIIGVNDTQVKLYVQGAGNNPPTLVSGLPFGGYGNNFGYNTAICINSTVTFSARDASSNLSFNYQNDFLTDRERIVSNCGQLVSGQPSTSFTDNTANGTYDLTNPQFSCFYNQTGVFNVRLFLQDRANPTDFTVFNPNSITIQVISGTPGQDCNLIDSVEPGELERTISQPGQDDFATSIGSVIDLLTGANEIVKLLIGLSFMFAAVIGAWMMSKNTWIALGGGMTTLLALTFINMFPLWVFVLMLITIVGLGILSWKNNG